MYIGVTCTLLCAILHTGELHYLVSVQVSTWTLAPHSASRATAAVPRARDPRTPSACTACHLACSSCPRALTCALLATPLEEAAVCPAPTPARPAPPSRLAMRARQGSCYTTSSVFQRVPKGESRESGVSDESQWGVDDTRLPTITCVFLYCSRKYFKWELWESYESLRGEWKEL